jgi:signal transduction histidine kinase/DNA-binding response OmpR family regulator
MEKFGFRLLLDFIMQKKLKKKLIPFDRSSHQLSDITLYGFHENKAGAWFYGNNGVYLVDLKNSKLLSHYNIDQKGKNYLPSNHIAHLFEDEDGYFWLATKGDGLIKWDPSSGQYKQYTQKGAGLSHNVLYAVYGDTENNLWISSQRGLMRFHTKSEDIQIYLEEDGLPHNEFNTIAHYQDEDGRLYFGGQNGLIHFHPKEIQQQEIKADFVLTACYKRQQDSSLNLTKRLFEEHYLEFYPNDKSLVIEFALLDFRNSKNHQYSYQLKGFDQDWHYQSEGKIRINSLPYGSYELLLRAKSANSGIWINYPSPIKIKVIPPFYLQWWFIILSVCIGLLFIYLVFRWRIAQLEERKKELEKIVAERTAKIEEDKALIEAQAEELKALDKLKSRFFANISHELRTPLTLILGPLSYLIDQPQAWDEEKVRKQLLRMQRNGKNLMQLIEEILDLSKLEANKLELKEEATSLRDFFEHIFMLFEAEFQNQGVHSELQFKLKDEQLHVLLDRDKIKKVVNNFLSNALKFTPSKGKISMSIVEEDDHILLKVIDTGKGVHPNDLPHIFERFYQSKQSDQKMYGGTGIGLALVSEFAELMGGKAYAESSLGVGSRFYFKFPKKKTEIIHQAESNKIIIAEDDPIESIGTDFTILVVEDNHDMRDFVAQLLQERYKKVLTAQNGAEGLAILELEGTNIDLILSDVMMPELDGLSLLQKIKSHPSWYKIPVIMLTALASERDKLDALVIGVDDYLSKPFSVAELLIRVQNLLYNYHQRRKWLSEEDKTTEEENEDQLAVDHSDNEVISETDWLKATEEVIRSSIPSNVLDVNGLAKKMLLSPRQLSRKLKSLTGLTPAKFIREIQLQIARKELENGKAISIAEVAYNSGFDNPNNFSTTFKKRFGKPPSDYLS